MKCFFLGWYLEYVYQIYVVECTIEPKVFCLLSITDAMILTKIKQKQSQWVITLEHQGVPINAWWQSHSIQTVVSSKTES